VVRRRLLGASSSAVHGRRCRAWPAGIKAGGLGSFGSRRAEQSDNFLSQPKGTWDHSLFEPCGYVPHGRPPPCHWVQASRLTSVE